MESCDPILCLPPNRFISLNLAFCHSAPPPLQPQTFASIPYSRFTEGHHADQEEEDRTWEPHINASTKTALSKREALLMINCKHARAFATALGEVFAQSHLRLVQSLRSEKTVECRPSESEPKREAVVPEVWAVLEEDEGCRTCPRRLNAACARAERGTLNGESRAQSLMDGDMLLVRM